MADTQRVSTQDAILFNAELEGAVTQVIRPAAILPESSVRDVLYALAMNDVAAGGCWQSTPTLWRRYDRPWESAVEPGHAMLIGSLQVAYGTPTKYEITVYRCTITQEAKAAGWFVQMLTNEALGFGGLDLATCPRAKLSAPPRVFPG